MNNDLIQNLHINAEQEERKAENIFKIMTNMLSVAHRLIHVYIKAKDVNKTIKNYNRAKAIELIAQNINKYAHLINILASLTGRYLVYTPNFYSDKSDRIILCDLKYVRNIIYFDEIKNAGLEMALRKALKKFQSA
jgi:hypothetical protein